MDKTINIKKVGGIKMFKPCKFNLLNSTCSKLKGNPQNIVLISVLLINLIYR